MKIARSVLLSFLALSWVLLSSHCTWATLPGFDFFRCCPTAAQEHGLDSCGESECHGANDEDTDRGCDGSDGCSLEWGFYHAPRFDQLHPTLVHHWISEFVAPHLPLMTGMEDDEPGTVCAYLAVGPPERASSWQFHTRTSLPSRAPSFAS